MKFDTVIIGGGFSGLIASVLLAEKGVNCAVVSTGAGALYFNSGSFDLLGYDSDGRIIENPLDGVVSLSSSHPYSKIGSAGIRKYAEEVKNLFQRMGFGLYGHTEKNHYRLTPGGEFKPTWLSMDEFFLTDDPASLPYKKATIVNITGFLDFPSGFIASGLEKAGVACRAISCTIPELEKIRKSPTEMRAVNIARELEKTQVLEKFAEELKNVKEDSDILLLPDVFGWTQSEITKHLSEKAGIQVKLIPALPPLVSGIRLRTKLISYFRKLGGYLIDGDSVTGGEFDKGKLVSVSTKRHGNITLKADNFILATGGIFSHGLVATPSGIYESVFGLDVDFDADRNHWFNPDFFQPQPYMRYGIDVNEKLQGKIDGESVSNLFISGASLGGADPLKEGCGSGIAIMSAFHIVCQILKKRNHGENAI